MFIHQIFISLKGSKITDKECYLESKKSFELFCKKYNHTYILWTEEKIDNLLKKHNLPTTFRFKFSKIDFARYVILNYLGGVYVDLDVIPKDAFNDELISDKEYLIYPWLNKRNKYEICNCIMKFNKGSLHKLIEYSLNQIKEKSKMSYYDNKPIRYFHQTTGNRMFRRFCLKENKPKLKYTEGLQDKVINYETKAWLSKSFE